MYARPHLHPARLIGASLLLLSALTTQAADALPGARATEWRQPFLTLLESDDATRRDAAMQLIRDGWHPSLLPMSLELIAYARPDPLIDELAKNVAATIGKTPLGVSRVHEWYFWLWNQDIAPPADYARFKARLYQHFDPRFAFYFQDRQDSARIRLDEIRWGGVRQDGIPPLRQPKMLAATEAGYLADDNIVFGIEIDGDARAYPKRVLAWHEMFVDTIGGVEIAGVYCTLCGTVVPFRTTVNGVRHELGTSGFLYRSNKLMYDKATQSLWSTTRGTPVLGPLVDQGIELPFESVVTTTWGEWRKRHPDTTVLSLDTGHRRNYAEGAAYADYFATDELMFNTPFKDTRLANKQEVLALRFAAAPEQQLAIDADFLVRHPVYADSIGLQRFVVLTDTSGANRVYEQGDVALVRFDGQHTATDAQGRRWTMTEAELKSNDGRSLARLPARRAFWFGWHAAFPQTRLVR